MEPKQVVIVSTPGRKLENLQNMLGSIDLLLNVKTVDSCQAALNVLLPERETVIFIDYRYPDTEMGGNIRDLILKSTNTHVVLLQN